MRTKATKPGVELGLADLSSQVFIQSLIKDIGLCAGPHSGRFGGQDRLAVVDAREAQSSHRDIGRVEAEPHAGGTDICLILRLAGFVEWIAPKSSLNF